MDEKTLARFWSKVEKTEGCWLWKAGKTKAGYGFFQVRSYTNRLAHRVSWLIHFGESPPADLFVCHRCDNQSCVRPDHLFLGTNADNVNDRENKRRGRNAKLTDAQAIEAIALLRQGAKHNEVAATFGVSRSAISLMAEGKTWRRFQAPSILRK